MNSKELVFILLLGIYLLKANAINGNFLIQTDIPTYQTDSLLIDDSNIQPREFNNLNDKYSDGDFSYETDQVNSGWWTRFKQWFRDLIKSWFNITNSEQASNLSDIIIKISGIIIFLLVSLFIFKAVMNEEGQWVFGKSSDKRIIPVADIESNLNVVDFNELTQDAENKEDFRLAIRYYYLWLLKSLSQQEVIHYDVEKTNSDYYNEIHSDSIRQQFSYTSYLYNYIWYGEFVVDQKSYFQAKKAFIEFLNYLVK